LQIRSDVYSFWRAWNLYRALSMFRFGAPEFLYKGRNESRRTKLADRALWNQLQTAFWGRIVSPRSRNYQAQRMKKSPPSFTETSGYILRGAQGMYGSEEPLRPSNYLRLGQNIVRKPASFPTLFCLWPPGARRTRLFMTADQALVKSNSIVERYSKDLQFEHISEK